MLAGVPSEQEYVAMYCAAAGVAKPDALTWSFYLALALFRAAAILAGVGARALAGNASSARAAEVGKKRKNIRVVFCAAKEIRSGDLCLSLVSFQSDTEVVGDAILPRAVEPSKHQLWGRAASCHKKRIDHVTYTFFCVSCESDTWARWALQNFPVSEYI